MAFDKIALEDHSRVATRSERIQNSKHWILRLNQDGVQQLLYQRLDFAQAKRACKILHDERVAVLKSAKANVPSC